MCAPSSHLVLCTCGDVTEGRDNSWAIYRRGEDDAPGIFVVGSMVAPTLMQTFIESKISEDLNRADAFDFSFDPAEGDLLILKMGSDLHRFAYKFGAWRSEGGFGAQDVSQASAWGLISLRWA